LRLVESEWGRHEDKRTGKASYLLGGLARTRLYVNSSIPPRNDAHLRLVEILREKDISFHRQSQMILMADVNRKPSLQLLVKATSHPQR
jgi:hypothetical protein